MQNVSCHAWTDDAKGQVKLAQAGNTEFSHTDSLPLKLDIRNTGRICRKVVVTTTEETWMRDAVSMVAVPAGFTCDLASIPRWLFCLVSPYDIALPGIVHDLLYRRQETTRRYADFVLFNTLEILGSPWYVRYPVWIAVRLFGKKAWEHNARRLKRESQKSK